MLASGICVCLCVSVIVARAPIRCPVSATVIDQRLIPLQYPGDELFIFQMLVNAVVVVVESREGLLA